MALTPDTTVSLAIIVSVASIVLAAINTILTGRRDRSTNERERVQDRDIATQRQLEIEKNFVKVNMKLDEFCETSKTLARSSERQAETITRLIRHLDKTDQRVEQLFSKVQDHENRIRTLESHDTHEGE